MFREGEGRVVVRLLRDAEIQAINLEKVSQEQAEIYNARIKVRNELKVCSRDFFSFYKIFSSEKSEILLTKYFPTAALS